MGNVSLEPVICTCGKEYVKASNRQKYCGECQKRIANEASKAYYKKTYVKKVTASLGTRITIGPAA